MWFFNKIPYHLPKAKGEFIPGVMDVMLDYNKNGLFMRMYYPTDAKTSIESDHAKWIHTMPDYDYIAGMATVAMVPPFVLNLAWLKSGKLQIPALYGEKIRNQEEEKFKCILFSHGLGALRSFYSAICIELASRGYIVAVIEHRDGSCCHTYYYESKEDAQKHNKTKVDFRKVRLGDGHHEVREEQVKYRSDEVCKALDFLINLNNGTVPHNVIDDVPTTRDVKFDLKDLVGKIDVDTLTVGGHSFGGATAMLCLSRRKEFKQGILLDPWMYPIKNEALETKIDQPMLFVNTYTFHIESNVKNMSLFLNDEKTRKMYTILRSTHESQTDSVFIAGYWLNWFMKKIDPLLALNINNAMILRFLKEFTGHEQNIKDSDICLKDNEKHYTEGLTKPWA